MTQDMNLPKIDRRIEAILERLARLGPMHPGSLSQQYNVCGKAGCRCKDPKKPQKHGPYHQLSFTWRGRSTTRFVRPERVASMERKVTNYKLFRELVNEWVDLEVERERAGKGRRAGGD
jgi:hypothetical protein